MEETYFGQLCMYYSSLNFCSTVPRFLAMELRIHQIIVVTSAVVLLGVNGGKKKSEMDTHSEMNTFCKLK